MEDKKINNMKKESIKKNDFVEIKYTGYSDGKVFDSNIEEDLKKINPKAKPEKTIIIVGQGMIVPGLDKSLEGKEIGEQYEIKLSAKDGFGERKRELVKTIPLKIFTEKKISPYPGLVLSMDNALAKVITISGARVVTDFNNPLAGKELNYKFSIIRKIEDENEKCKDLFELLLKTIPEFELKEKDIILRGRKDLEFFVTAFKDKFKELLGKELKFELKEEKREDEKVKEKKVENNVKKVEKKDKNEVKTN